MKFGLYINKYEHEARHDTIPNVFPEVLDAVSFVKTEPCLRKAEGAGESVCFASGAASYQSARSELRKVTNCFLDRNLLSVSETNH